MSISLIAVNSVVIVLHGECNSYNLSQFVCPSEHCLLFVNTDKADFLLSNKEY
jgi:hypothetical protein